VGLNRNRMTGCPCNRLSRMVSPVMTSLSKQSGAVCPTSAGGRGRATDTINGSGGRSPAWAASTLRRSVSRASRYGVRVVNCSWGTQGFFDPDDPVNVATRILHDSGITVVFASGNYGPSPDTLNPYSVAPWVVGVGSVRKDGRLSSFSSRGIFEELLYHPTLIAPGESITAASPAALNGGASYSVASGTSFSAPVVSGIAAQILARHPSWTPDQVKGALMVTATTAPSAPALSLGVGEVDGAAAAAVVAPPNPNEGLDQFVNTDANGAAYFDGAAWNAAVAANPSWQTASWTNASWTNASWTNASWTNASWTNSTYTDASWTNASWTNASWTNASWTNASWTNASWTNESPAP